MRPIDADKLERHCKAVIEQSWNHTSAPASWAQAFATFLDLLETSPTIDTQRWIPASEPPKEWAIKDDVLVSRMIDYLAYSRADGMIYLANWFKPVKRWLVDGESVEISHWMPLPEEPEEKE